MRPNVEYRRTKDGVEYLCPEDGWVKPKVWDGTGYEKYVCPGCDLTLDEDPFGSWERERNGGEE